jgi:hypothetical protein
MAVEFDLKTQLMIEKVAQGAQLEATLNSLLDEVNDQIEAAGLAPITLKFVKQMNKEIEREYDRFLKDIEKGMLSWERHLSGLLREEAKMRAKELADIAGGDWKGVGIDTVGQAPKQKPFYEIGEMMPKKSAQKGGIMGELGLGDAAMAGGVAGAVAGAVVVVGTALVKVMGEMVKQSKIVGVAMDSWNKAMGLLMDLILIPFIPLLVYGIVKLYKGIVDFGLWWNNAWKVIKKEGLFGLLKLGLEWVWGQLDELAEKILRWFFNDEEGAGSKLVDVAISLGLIMGGFFGFLSDKIIGAIVDLVFGEGSYENAKKIVIDIAANLLNDILGFLYDVWFAGGKLFYSIDWKAAWDSFCDWVHELAKNPAKGITTFLHWLTGSVGAFIDWIYQAIIHSKTYELLYDIGLHYVNDLIAWLYGAAKGVVKIAVDIAGGKLPSFDVGGIVPGIIGQPQLAIVHGGEEVVPAGGNRGGNVMQNKSGQTNNTFNFYGLTDSQLQDKVRSVLRQDATRYSQ